VFFCLGGTFAATRFSGVPSAFNLSAEGGVGAPARWRLSGWGGVGSSGRTRSQRMLLTQNAFMDTYTCAVWTVRRAHTKRHGS
jgi:hypothetical protein